MIDDALRPLRFGIVGLVNTTLGLGVIFASKAFLDLGDFAANAFGYAIGLLVSFALNRNWTFHDRGRQLAALARFVAAFAVAYGLNLAAVFTLRDGLRLNAYAAQAAGVIPYTLAFYLLSARYVFSEKGVAGQLSNQNKRESMRGP
jgi:putative flippase GtrA